MCYFRFSVFWIVLNVLAQQVNATEVEVSVKIEQQQRSISHDRVGLTHYSLVLLFYTPWKHQKTLYHLKISENLKVHTSPQLRWITRCALALHLALQRVSGYLWHSSKWPCQFGCVFQYTSGLEMLAYHQHWV